MQQLGNNVNFLKAGVGISIKPMYFITAITKHNSVKTTVFRSCRVIFANYYCCRIDKKEVYSVNFLDAVRFVRKAWERVLEKAIRNCFRHAGIIQKEVSTKIECSVATSEEDENDLPLSEWVRRIDSVNFASCDLDGFSTVADDILTTGTLTAEDNCDGSKKLIKQCI